ncbi:MAG: hypothetical protein ABI461_09915 [Polyangiaceae bacterium]
MRNRIAVGLAVVGCVLSFGSAALAYGESDTNGFPNWSERVLLEWTNRARSDPQADLGGCTSCGDKACYSAVPPYAYSANLNHSSRFHSAENTLQNYGCLDHYSHCTIATNIATTYPAACTGLASCACTGGADTCASGTCPCTTGTAPSARVGMFGTSMMFEGISSYDDPNSAFYQWLNEPYSGSSCEYDQGSGPGSTNGHRFQLVKGEYGGQNATAAGFGVVAGSVAVVDEGVESTVKKIPSGSHYPRQAASVDAWANWADAAGPQSALVNVDGECTALHLERGAATNGAYHVALTGVGSGCHRYFFDFKDSSGAIVTYPETGSLGIGPTGTCDDWNATRPATGASCSCTPMCSGKTCGDDSCGGACGNCATGSTCNASGACVGGSVGDGGSSGGDGGLVKRDGGGSVDSEGGPGDGDGDGTTPGGDSSSSCGCGVVGESPVNSAGFMIAGIALAFGWSRRRRTR